MIETQLLVVDGSPSVRSATSRLLADLGCAADTCASLDEALQYLLAHRPRLLLVDAHLPTSDGRDALAELRANPALAAMAIVICTTQDAPTTTEQWMQRSAAGVLIKPVTSAQLEPLLMHLLPEPPQAKVPSSSPEAAAAEAVAADIETASELIAETAADPQLIERRAQDLEARIADIGTGVAGIDSSKQAETKL